MTCAKCSVDPGYPPVDVSNQPALSRLTRRVGTHERFLRAMLHDIGRQPELSRLTTRDASDPTIATLDAAAVVLDVLAFYSERIATEGYLRTATERRSVLELARSIGYELAPGVASATRLAFTIETAEGSPESVALDIGTQAQSIPGEGELPQIFETVAALEAMGKRNSLRPRISQPALPVNADTRVYLAGTATGIRPGDPLLVTVDEPIGTVTLGSYTFRRVTAVEPVEAPADPQDHGAPAHTVVDVHLPLSLTVPPGDRDPGARVFRRRAALFGHNALAYADLPLPLRVGERHPETYAFIAGPYASSSGSWADQHFSSSTTQIWLDQVYSNIAVGSWVVLTTSVTWRAFKVTGVADDVHSAFALSGPATRLTITGPGIESFSPKNAVVHIESERLDIGVSPITSDVTGAQIQLDPAGSAAALELSEGRELAVTGLDSTGAAVAEIVELDTVTGDAQLATLVLKTALVHTYQRASLRVLGNVAPATAGQTWSEVLGEGDARVPHQSFVLANVPLTYVAATTASGSESTLLVRVDGVEWTEVPTLYGQGPEAEVFVTRLADDGSVTVRFGDGETGSRLATGATVSATYRVGAGPDGDVPGSSITLPLSRPLGLSGLTNPLAAAGGDAAERLELARRNAPGKVTAMGRVVSLLDFEDFARAFRGIGKAAASDVWNGWRKLVHLTVTRSDGSPLASDPALKDDLRAAIDAARHPELPVEVVDYEPVLFRLKVAVQVDASYEPTAVVEAVTAAIIDRYSFKNQGLGQSATMADVHELVHALAGVDGVVMTAMHVTGDPEQVADVIAQRGRWISGALHPAQIVTVDQAVLEVSELQDVGAAT